MNSQILLIEDDQCVRELLHQTLSRAGYEVIPASDGDEGLDLFRNNHPDLVITDIVMPQKEGLQMILELRRHSPDAKVIAMSGGGRYSNTDYLKLARKFGAQATLCKPFLREEILNAVKEVLGEPQELHEAVAGNSPTDRGDSPNRH
jgi:YesN/AraC family two-component response regulator